MNPVAIRNPRFGDVVGDAVMEKLAGGFGFTEGPVWHPYEKWLVFSDIPGSRMHRLLASGEIEVFRDPSNKANGNTLDRQGRLLSCEHATSRVTRAEPDGTVTVLASHYGDKTLNSPNDIVVATGGAVYFTDPTYGRQPFFGVPREPELTFRGVYRIDADGASPTLLVDDFAQPNGLCFSLDESRLFSGEALGVIPTPEPCANFTFGDEDLRSLYITASTSLHRLRVRVPGLRLF
jgi:gluconolactonase